MRGSAGRCYTCESPEVSAAVRELAKMQAAKEVRISLMRVHRMLRDRFDYPASLKHLSDHCSLHLGKRWSDL